MTEPEPVGSITEEAFKLFRAMGSASHADADESSTHVCSTSWCPICQVVGFVHDNPEGLTQLSQSAATLVRSLRDLLDAALTPEENP